MSHAVKCGNQLCPQVIVIPHMSSRHKYCSSRCRAQAWRRRKREERNAAESSNR